MSESDCRSSSASNRSGEAFPTTREEDSDKIKDLNEIVSALEEKANEIELGCKLFEKSVSDLTLQIDEETDRARLAELREELRCSRHILMRKLDLLADTRASLASYSKELISINTRLGSVTPFDEVIPSIDDHKMSFVNRSETVKELLTQVHWTNYVRSTRAGGLEPKIPFLDNLFGMGKSTFAENYISECNKIINSVPGSLEFKASISHARTLIVQINPGELYNCQEKETLFVERVVADTFISAIEEHIPNRIQGTTSSLKGISGSYLLKGVVSRFIHETNEPLFLVFDEIGLAFQRPSSRISSEDDENLRSQKESFLFFCQVIVHSLLIRSLHI